MAQFACVKYPGKVPAGVEDGLRGYLEEKGVPRAALTIFRASETLFMASCEGLEYRVEGLVVGFSREDEQICIDLASGCIMLLANWSPTRPLKVNRDIFSFVDSLMVLQDMVPLYGADRDIDDAEIAEVRVRSALEQIDPMATEDPNGFWNAFLDDVAVGDYPG